MKLKGSWFTYLAIFIIFVVPLPLLLREAAFMYELGYIPSVILYAISFGTNIAMIFYLVGVFIQKDR